METTYRLKKPLILGFVYDDIEREEAVTHVTVAVRIGGADDKEREACRSLYERIDMTGLAPFTVGDLAAMDVSGGLRDAYDQAALRARRYCRAKAQQISALEVHRSSPKLEAVQ